MDDPTDKGDGLADGAQVSLSAMPDVKSLMAIRVRPAQAARLFGVSRQSMSQWIKKGWLTINPIDGRLDLQHATDQILKHADLGRIRAPFLKSIVSDMNRLVDQAGKAIELEGDLRAARARIAELDRELRFIGNWLELFDGLLLANESLLRATTGPDEWRAAQQELLEQAEFTAIEALDNGLEH